MAEEDKISSLPDHLLLEIISRIKIMDKRKLEERLMSTKEVIKTTTTISKRWRHLWTLLPTLVFLHSDVTNNFSKNYIKKVTNYFLFIDETLTQCPTDVNLKKFKLQILGRDEPTLQINRWIHYAITRNVQQIDLSIPDRIMYKSCDDELFFNNSCLVSMEVSRFGFNPPNGVIRWDNLKFLRIDEGRLNEYLIEEILSGSPCLETLELNDCNLAGRIAKSLFRNFGVLERLSCCLETYETFSYNDELFLDESFSTSLHCMFNPPTGAIRCDKLKFLCIYGEELDEDLIGNILSRSPFLKTLELNLCYGFRRIDVTSKSVKNLVLSNYEDRCPWEDYYVDTLEINAPYISSLAIKGNVCSEKILLQDVSSLVKVDLDYSVPKNIYFLEAIGLDPYVVEEQLLRGLLSSLVHVNEIALGVLYKCLEALSRLEATGFQFRKASYLRGIYPNEYQVFFIESIV